MNLILQLLAGLIGMALVMYAKNAQKFIPAVAGAALMIVPFFIESVVLQAVVCGVLTALPFIFRDD